VSWFGGKSDHKKQVDAGIMVLGNLYEKTTDGGSDAPLVLRFEMADSRFRYLVFCLGTFQMACARRMKSPDSVLNELLRSVVIGAVGDAEQQQLFFGGPTDPQHAANLGAQYVQEFLNQWSAYVDIAEGGNANAATSLIAGMLRSTESAAPASAADGHRLWPLAEWIEDRLDAMGGAFSNMSK
jgi:hypothetical protein